MHDRVYTSVTAQAEYMTECIFWCNSTDCMHDRVHTGVTAQTACMTEYILVVLGTDWPNFLILVNKMTCTSCFDLKLNDHLTFTNLFTDSHKNWKQITIAQHTCNYVTNTEYITHE